ncbi:MAG: hypothetical protein ABIL09_19970 [Gemmatimonadota bacterium]
MIPCCLWLRLLVAGLAAVPLLAAAELPGPVGTDAARRSRQPRTVLDLQPCLRADTAAVHDGTGRRGTAILVDLSPAAASWYLLQLRWPDGSTSEHHLQNPEPRRARVLLDPAYPNGLVLEGQGGRREPCDLWSGSDSPLTSTKPARSPYTPLCGGRLYLRNTTAGHKTSKEWATDFLRDYVPGGERIASFVRDLYVDVFATTSELLDPALATGGQAPGLDPGSPAPPLVDPRFAGQVVLTPDLGIDVGTPTPGHLEVGRWYRALGAPPGVFVSAFQPQVVDADVLARQKGLVNPLDATEEAAMVYLVAFDLTRLELGYSVGTEHPRVDWSDRIRPEMRDPSLPGPDGIASVDPLVRTGILPPYLGRRAVAAFTGGFKRFHGAFRWGDLATANRGSHYGFMEQGVIMSRLQPGLATAIVYVDGTADLKTWRRADEGDLCRIRHARQNGVAIVEPDAATGVVRPGALVRRTGPGNWSGSVDGKFRTLRAGIGLQDENGRPFLIYGYFSAATASAMARVFQAYRCRYAMLTDMNAFEHTYLALYRATDAGLDLENLVTGMSALDKVSQDQVVPRFLGYADNRDFFYLVRKEVP